MVEWWVVGVLWMVEVILVINIVSKMVVHGQLVVTSYNSVKTHYCLKYKQTNKQTNKQTKFGMRLSI